MRFTDPRTLQKVKELGLPSAYYFIYTIADPHEEVIFPTQIWDAVSMLAFPENAFQGGTTAAIIGYFQSKGWMLEEDLHAERVLRRRIQSKVADKYTHVSAGSRIIDQGERVTARHLAMLQAMKKALSEQRNLWHPLTLLGSLCMSVLLTAICITYFRINHADILHSNRKLLLLVTVVILCFVISKSIEFFLLTSTSNLIEVVKYPLVVPFAAILICCLINPNIATFTAGFLTIIFTLTLAFERQAFMLLNLAAALVAILSTRTLRRRKEIFIVCAKAWLCSVVVIFSMYFYQNTLWSMSILADMLSTAIFMFFTAVSLWGCCPSGICFPHHDQRQPDGIYGSE